MVRGMPSTDPCVAVRNYWSYDFFLEVEMNLSMYALEYKLNTSFSRFLNLVIIIMVSTSFFLIQPCSNFWFSFLYMLLLVNITSTKLSGLQATCGLVILLINPTF